MNLDAATGFEEGQPVPVTTPEIYFDDPPEASGPAAPLPQVLDLLTFGTSDLRQIGERAVLLAFCDRRCQYRPKSFRELGDWIGCSHTAARKKVSTFLRIIKGEFHV